MESAGRRMFEEARDGGELTDMDFVLDSGRKVRGHKSWLMARCDYIRGMLSSGMREGKTGIVRVRGCSEGAFLAILEFLYIGRLGDACIGQDWEELFRVSDMFVCEGMGAMLLDAVTMANIEDAVKMAVGQGVKRLMERCVEALPSRPATVDEARRVTRVMAVLCKCGDADDWELVGKGIGAVVAAMRAYTKDTTVQAAGCDILTLATNSCVDNRHIASSKSGMEAIVGALKAHTNSAKVSELGCTALLNLCASNDSNKRRAGNDGGVDAIVEAIKSHVGNALVQEQGCSVLSSLCAGIHENVRRAEKSGGVDAVLGALKTHKCKEVQKQGCAALRQLCAGSYENRRRAGDAGGVEAVLEALKTHMPSAGVQEQGCAALWNLCVLSNENKRRAGSAGGVEAVVDALKAHRVGIKVQVQCCGAIMNLCAGIVENKIRAGEAGGIEAVVDALRAHRGCAQVQSNGCGALINIIAASGNADNARRAEEAGALEAVTETLRISVATLESAASNATSVKASGEVGGKFDDDETAIFGEVIGNPDQEAVQRQARAALELLSQGLGPRV